MDEGLNLRQCMDGGLNLKQGMDGGLSLSLQDLVCMHKY